MSEQSWVIEELVFRTPEEAFPHYRHIGVPLYLQGTIIACGLGRMEDGRQFFHWAPFSLTAFERLGEAKCLEIAREEMRPPEVEA